MPAKRAMIAALLAATNAWASEPFCDTSGNVISCAYNPQRTVVPVITNKGATEM